MATRTISTRLAIEGEDQYRQALKNCNDSMRTMQSELARLQSQYQGQANSLTALEAKGNALNVMYEKQREKVQQTQSALENARAAQSRYADQVENCRNRLSAAQTELERLRNSTGNTTQAQRALERQTGNLNRELRQAEEREQAAACGVSDWTRQNNYAQRDLNNLSREIQQNNRYLDEARNSTDGLARSIDRYGREVRDAGDDSRRFGAESAAAIDALSGALAASGVAAALGQIKEALVSCTESAMQFEKGMAEVFTLLPGQSDTTYQKLSEDMLKFSSDMNVLTTEGVPALYSAVSAGVDSNNVFEFMTTAQKAAIGGVTDLETAVDGLTSIVNAYGKSNINAQQTADMMFTAVKLGKTNFEQLSASIYNVVPTAAAAKIGFGDVAAALAVITAQGVPTATATTQLRQMLVELTNSTQKAGMAFEAVTGQSFKKFIAGGGNVQEALQKLEQHAKESGIGVNELFSSVESGNAALSLTGQATESFTHALGEMENSAGAVDTAYNTMTETAEYASQRVQVAMENVKTAIGTALLPAFQNLADAAADGLDWAADFVAMNPWLVQAITALTIGLAAFTVSVTAARIAMMLFNFVMEASPAVRVASAIGAVTAALLIFMASTENAVTKVAELSRSLNESQKAYEQTTSAIQQDNDSLLAMVDALETLAGLENKTTAEKEAILAIVNDLNEAVPELSLAYDMQTNSLNMTAEAVRNLALAEAGRSEQEAALERLKELYVEQAQIEAQLTEATEALAAAQAESADQATQYQNAVGPSMTQVRDMAGALNKEKQAVAELTNIQKQNQDQIYELQAKYHEYSVMLGETTKAGKAQEMQTAEQSVTINELTAVTKQLIAGENALSKAFEEQKKSGELSLDTILSLIEAGQANMLTIDNETGAVELNTGAYIAMYTEKINDQIASLETQRVSINTVLALKDEALMTTDLAKGYLRAAVARSELEGQKISVAAQISQLEALKKSITSYSGTATKAASSTRKASATVKSQAEKDLDEFKKLQAALDHEKAVGEKTEEEYYRKLQEYRDRYLTSEDNIDTYRSITEGIYGYEQGLLDEQLKNYEAHLQDMLDAAAGALKEIQDQYDTVLAQQEEMQNKLANYGNLFEMKDDKLSVNDIQEQLDVMDQYYKTISDLKKEGISDSLMDEVLSREVDEAVAYGSKLLEMGDQQWEEYNNLWEEKQQLAKDIASEFFKTELETLETEYNEKLGEALDTLKDTSFDSGRDAAQGLIDGLANKEEAIYKKAKQIADKVAATLAAAFNSIGDDDSEKKERTSGSHAGGLSYVPFDGYVAELHRGERVLTTSEAKAYIDAAQPSSLQVPAANTERQTESIVNALATLTSGLAPARETKDGPATIILQTGDGIEVARWLLPSIREASDQSPRTRGDDFT